MFIRSGDHQDRCLEAVKEMDEQRRLKQLDKVGEREKGREKAVVYSVETCKLFELAHEKAARTHRAAAIKFGSESPQAEEQIAWANVHQLFAEAFCSAQRDMDV